MIHNTNQLVEQHKRIEILKTVSIFSSTNDNILTEIAVQLNEITLNPEDTLFSKGDQGDSMYIVVEGKIRVHDGAHIFDIVEQGQVFGEYSVLDTEERSASISSITQSLLLELRQEVFYNIVMQRVDIVKGILQILVNRSRRQNQLEEKLTESNQMLEQKRALLKKEKQKSDDLLLNILPQAVADELRIKGYSTARNYDLVSVLFADIKGFTSLSQKMPPSELLKYLEHYFTGFDDIMDKYGLEKIKTIGDAYMAAGGMPKSNMSNPIEIVCVGLAMQHFMQDQSKEGGLAWRLRLGIHSGPVVAGVIGKKKFAYDVWGDTVNTASRMESFGEIDRVNISEATYELIKDYFECEYRGEVDVKGKGLIGMYFVNRLKSEFSDDELGIRPTQGFLNAVRRIRQDSEY